MRSAALPGPLPNLFLPILTPTPHRQCVPAPVLCQARHRGGKVSSREKTLGPTSFPPPVPSRRCWYCPLPPTTGLLWSEREWTETELIPEPWLPPKTTSHTPALWPCLATPEGLRTYPDAYASAYEATPQHAMLPVLPWTGLQALLRATTLPSWAKPAASPSRTPHCLRAFARARMVLFWAAAPTTPTVLHPGSPTGLCHSGPPLHPPNPEQGLHARDDKQSGAEGARPRHRAHL